MHYSLLVAAFALTPTLLPAQTPTEWAQAAETITAEDITRHIDVITNDSMLGRDTSGRGLEKTAGYVADQLQRLGLKPGGTEGTWFQRYLLPPKINVARSKVVFTGGGKTATASFERAASMIAIPSRATHADVNFTTLAGRPTAKSKSLQQAQAKSNTVVYIAPAKADDAEQENILSQLLSHPTIANVIVLGDRDWTDFARHKQRERNENDSDFTDRLAIQIRPDSVDGLKEMLAAGGVDLAWTSTDTTPVLREVPSIQISLELQLDRTTSDRKTAPNVVGLLEGSDSNFNNDYIVFSAHMDHIGLGADDNASGTAGLIELAKAFSQPGARPARPLAFLATSGATLDFLGSTRFTRQINNNEEDFLGNVMIRLTAVREELAISRAVAAVNLDMIGRPAGDSIVVSGLSHIESATPLSWIAAAHPELRLSLIDGGAAATASPESDHSAFIRKGTPSLYFHNGTHDQKQAPGLPTTIDPDQEARILRLVFYVGQQLANGQRPPIWNAEGRQHYLNSMQHP